MKREVGVLVQAVGGGPERLEDLVHALVPAQIHMGSMWAFPIMESTGLVGSGGHDAPV